MIISHHRCIKQYLQVTVVFLLLVIVSACNQATNKNSVMQPSFVGDIHFDPAVDTLGFQRCYEGHIFQYFNDSKGLQYAGEKPALERAIFQNYAHEVLKGESGMIRIRFVVNCEGKPGWFRLIAMDENFKEKTFPESISGQLLKITQSLEGWQSKYIQDSSVDYYQYLLFKIKDAQLIQVLP